MKKKEYYSLLNEVYKPGRYLGREVNSIKKRCNSETVKFVLAFPDLYEIGMSHLGLQILYNILNKEKDVLAERVYMPDLDFIEKLRNNRISLFSLESRREIAKFDIVGFSLQNELNYTNVLAMIELSHIPIYAKDRKSNHPLIIAGGPCVSNPEPVAEFFDFICLGEGEEVILEIVNLYKEYKNLKRKDLLWKFAQIEGIYVPCFYEAVKEKEEVFVIPKYKQISSKIKKRKIKDLNKVKYPIAQLIPLVETVHNRAVLEIERGCTGGCRFCHSGMINRPVRGKDKDNIIKNVWKIIKNTGFREISLLALSVTDFCGAIDLLKVLIDSFKEKKITVSFPSMRANEKVLELAKVASIIKKTGITIAPEAGTDRMRKIINKKITREEIINLTKEVFKMGYQSIKLYFMIGLPFENEKDIAGIIDLVKEIRSYGGKKKRIRVSISSFIPKPHTPFQWEGHNTIQEIKRKQKMLIENTRGKGIELSWHQLEQSIVEAALARGDRKIAAVIKKAYKYGCFYDSWSDRFNYKLWETSFKEEGLSLSNYAFKKIDFKSKLPWDHIDMGVNKKYLVKEYLKATKGEESSDCRYGKCFNCGACEIKEKKDRIKNKRRTICKDASVLTGLKSPMHKVRFRYQKLKDMKFLSQLDVTRIIKQMLQLAELPIVIKEGFNPQIKISFGRALPLGIESICEHYDVFLWERIDLDRAINKMNKKLPLGLKVLDGHYISLKEESIFSTMNTGIFEIEVSLNKKLKTVEDRIKEYYNNSHKIYFERRSKKVLLSTVLKSIELNNKKGNKNIVNMVLKDIFDPKKILAYLEEDINVKNVRCVEYFKMED
ncbi:MAG: TIGR03960 family B12-binding radical SAM protein [bacterium]|nr:TIGR03960 family B12-binding radical SAM protein [bacterium]